MNETDCAVVKEKIEINETEGTKPFGLFKNQFDQSEGPEAKLQLAISFMENSFANGSTIHFRSFWEARKSCIPLFKENIPQSIKSQLWLKYQELSKEARRLKETLDEQSAFAVEQIEIAIRALEEEINQFPQLTFNPGQFENLQFPVFLIEKKPSYLELQNQLNILNAQASRINALRKELLKTEMRIRHKNKFFQRLSLAGDQVFPKRKELIREMSQFFSDDIDSFISLHFDEKVTSKEMPYVLREEIKILQGLAKALTLNTHSFTQTRARLSECWDKIKIEEKEKKKERAQQKVIYRNNSESIDRSISELREQIEQKKCTSNEAQKQMDEIVLQMRRIELGREELRILRDNLGVIRKKIQEIIKEEEEEKNRIENERNQLKKEKFLSLKLQAEDLISNHPTLELSQLIQKRDQLVVDIQDSILIKLEKQEIERMLKPLKDIIVDRQEKQLLDLSDDERKTLENLKSILIDRKERRQEIKNQLKNLRQSINSFDVDFEKTMNQIHEEEDRLEKTSQGIKEIETKIQDLQSKLKAKNEF